MRSESAPIRIMFGGLYADEASMVLKRAQNRPGFSISVVRAGEKTGTPPVAPHDLHQQGMEDALDDLHVQMIVADKVVLSIDPKAQPLSTNIWR